MRGEPSPTASASNSHYVEFAAFGVHPLGCHRPPNTLKGGHQTSVGAKLRTAETLSPLILLPILFSLLPPGTSAPAQSLKFEKLLPFASGDYVRIETVLKSDDSLVRV